MEVLSTLDIFASTRIASHISDGPLGDLVFNSLRNARMRVPAEFRDWVVALIGEDRARSCPSFGTRRGNPVKVAS
jgi:hypothetical protein